MKQLDCPVTNAADYFNQEFSAFYHSYQSSRDFQKRFAIWSDLITRYAQLAGAATCLDIGCGPGLFSFYTAAKGIATFGVDPSAQMLELCEYQQERYRLDNVHFTRGQLPLDDELEVPKVDLILCSSVLEYVANWDPAVLGIVDRLNPGGYLLASLPNRQSIYRQYERLKYQLLGRPEYYRYVRHVIRLEEAIAYFGRFGLTCAEYHFYGSEPLLSRLTSRVCGARFSNNLYVLVLKKPA